MLRCGFGVLTRVQISTRSGFVGSDLSSVDLKTFERLTTVRTFFFSMPRHRDKFNQVNTALWAEVGVVRFV